MNEGYFWYRVVEWMDGDYRMHYYMGRKYVGFASDPHPKLIDKYNMKYIGYGDCDTYKRNEVERHD